MDLQKSPAPPGPLGCLPHLPYPVQNGCAPCCNSRVCGRATLMEWPMVVKPIQPAARRGKREKQEVAEMSPLDGNDFGWSDVTIGQINENGRRCWEELQRWGAELVFQLFQRRGSGNVGSWGGFKSSGGGEQWESPAAPGTSPPCDGRWEYPLCSRFRLISRHYTVYRDLHAQ